MMKQIILKMMKMTKKHPISTVLLVFYIVMSVVQGNAELFLVGFLAASAAYASELMFRATGMIRTGRYCAGRPRSNEVKGRQNRRFCDAAWMFAIFLPLKRTVERQTGLNE